MTPLTVENSDIFGREGNLEIENKKVPTPNYLPTRNEFLNLQDSPFVDKKDYKNVNFGVYGYWFSKDTLKNMSNSGKTYNNIKNYVIGRIQLIDTPVKMLHFEFNPDVARLNTQTLKLLLDLQVSAGANVIEIPHIKAQSNYKKLIETTFEWKKSNLGSYPLMGIAYTSQDVKIIKSKLTGIDAVGVHVHSEDYTTLYEIETTIRPLNIWTHAFSAPRSYKSSDYKGTMGIFLNKFGIDTYSSYVAPSEVARNFSYAAENKNDEEKLNDAKHGKYFNPTDYSTTKYSVMDQALNPNNNEEIKLSKFCSCPVCSHNSIQSIVSNFNTAFANTRSHEVLANIDESSIVKKKIKSNEFDKYLSSKKFAFELTKRSQSKLPT